MNKKKLLCALGATAIAVFGLAPTAVVAQDYECSDCNILTDECSAPGTGTAAFCYQAEDPEGEAYCNTYGGVGDCDPVMTSIGADGIPLDNRVLSELLAPVYTDGLAAATDCRQRVRAVLFQPTVAAARRAEVARIVI
jgi:hypothetical protein